MPGGPASRFAVLAALVPLGVGLGVALGVPGAGSATEPPGSVLAYSYRVGLDQTISREAVFSDGPHHLLVVGGYFGATRSPGAAVETFDTATGRVAVEGSIAAPLAEAARVDLGGAEMLLGGSTSSLKSPANDVESAKVLKIGQGPRTANRVATIPVGEMPTPRAGAGATLLGSRAIVAGGYDSPTSNLAAVLATGDGRHFTVVSNLVQAVRYPAVAPLDGEVLVIGGEAVESGQPEPVDEVQAVTPGRRAARIVARLPEPVSAPAAWVVAGRLYVAGGDSALSSEGVGTTTSDSIWVYNVRSREFSLAGYLSLPVSHAGVLVVGDDTFIVGGESQGTAVTTVQEIVPVR